MACKEKNAKGKPCKAPEVGSSGYCYFHHPEKVKDRALAQARGGHRPNRKRPEIDFPGELEKVADVTAWVNALLADNWFGAPPGDKRTRTAAALLRIGLEALQVSSLEQRVAELEALLLREAK